MRCLDYTLTGAIDLRCDSNSRAGRFIPKGSKCHMIYDGFDAYSDPYDLLAVEVNFHFTPNIEQGTTK